MPFVEKDFRYKDAMELSKSHLALLVLSHRRSIVLLEKRISELEPENEQANPADKIQLGEILECPSCHATGQVEVFRR